MKLQAYLSAKAALFWRGLRMTEAVPFDKRSIQQALRSVS
jgi:hypothetical protein